MSGGGYTFKQSKTVARGLTIGELSQNQAPVFQQDVEAANRNRVTVKNVSSSMKLKERKKELGDGLYSDAFRDLLTPEERAAQIKDSGSELYTKANNKKLLDGAHDEYLKENAKLTKKLLRNRDIAFQATEWPDSFKYLTHLLRIKDTKFDEKVILDFFSTDVQKRYEALDRIVEDFVNQDFSFDFSSDAAFARASLRMEQMNQRAESFKYTVTQNFDYWQAMAEESRVAIMEKLSEASAIWGFYKARKALLCDAFYSEHLDKEMSAFNVNGNLGVNLRIHNLISDSERAYEKLRHRDEEDADTKAYNIVSDKIDKEQAFKTVAVRKNKNTATKSQGFQFLDLFGIPLNFISWLMRGKRTNDHDFDSVYYNETKNKKLQSDFDAIPEPLKFIGKNEHEFLYATQGPNGVPLAPHIDLVPLFKDQIKLDIIKEVEDNAGLEIKGYDEKEKVTDEIRHEANSYILYTEFISAAKKYSAIGGIVNADTTEMEMVYLDTMRNYWEGMIKQHGSREDATPVQKKRVEVVNKIWTWIRENRYGSLERVTQKDVYNAAKEMSQTVIQDTTYGENLDESNIKDIPLFTHQPNINDIKQGTIGDCYLVAAMTTLVKADPKAILNMFQDLGDGDVMVRMYEAYDKLGNRLDTGSKWNNYSSSDVVMKPVFVKVRKHYETGDGNANDCVWPQLLEKAYAVSGFNMKGTLLVDKKGHFTGLEQELTCGSGNIALSHLTGTFLKDTSILRPLTDEENIAYKHKYVNLFDNEMYRDRFSCGIPRFFIDFCFNNLIRTDREYMTREILFYRFEHSCAMVLRDFNIKLLQIKKNYIRNGMNREDYVPVIEKIVESMGLTVFPDWDTRSFQDFDIDKDFQMWNGIIDPDSINNYIELFKRNFNELRNGTVYMVQHGKGLDRPEFGYQTVYGMLDELANTGIAGNGILKDAQVQKTVNKKIDDTLNFGGSQELMIEKKREEAAQRASTWAEVENYRDATFLLKRLDVDDHENCRDNTLSFIADLQDALKAGGCIEVCINHYVSAIGLEKLNGTYYVLIKDPFNVYNMQYWNNNGQIEKQEEGFLEVMDIDGYKQKRHLDHENPNMCYYGGFRGLSYWKAEDICNKMQSYTVLKGSDIRSARPV